MDSGKQLDERFGQAFIQAMSDESNATAAALHLKAEEQHRIGKCGQDPGFVRHAEQLGRFQSNNPFYDAGHATGKFLGDAINLAGDDLYTAYCRWAEKPEDLGTLAAKLNVDANFALAHGQVGRAVSNYQRELRLIKSCGGTGSALAAAVERNIKALEFPSAYTLSADMVAEIDLLRAKGN